MAELDKIRKFEFDKYIWQPKSQHILFLCAFIYFLVDLWMINNINTLASLLSILRPSKVIMPLPYYSGPLLFWWFNLYTAGTLLIMENKEHWSPLNGWLIGNLVQYKHESWKAAYHYPLPLKMIHGFNLTNSASCCPARDAFQFEVLPVIHNSHHAIMKTPLFLWFFFLFTYVFYEKQYFGSYAVSLCG